MRLCEINSDKQNNFFEKCRKHCTKNEVFHEEFIQFLHLLKKSLMENFIFCAVKIHQETPVTELFLTL